MLKDPWNQEECRWADNQAGGFEFWEEQHAVWTDKEGQPERTSFLPAGHKGIRRDI